MVKDLTIIQSEQILRGKRILVTGHTGFVGTWLSIWLHEMGCEVYGYALENPQKQSAFYLSGIEKKIAGSMIADIRDLDCLWNFVSDVKPDFVFHLAAQPLVLLSYEYPVETYSTNVMGTLNVMECVRRLQQDLVSVIVTTDKCYENKEWLWGYRETDSLGGADPYSSSKACCELLVSSYRTSYFNTDNRFSKKAATVRAGNIIGGGDWAENRIIPDCIRALLDNQKINVRNPLAVRPWQHVIEPVWGYIQLAATMATSLRNDFDSYNYGPVIENCVNVEAIVKMVVAAWGSGSWETSCAGAAPKESRYLSLDTTKVRREIGWKPTWNIGETILKTVQWYKDCVNGDAYKLCVEQIAQFTSELQGCV